MDARQAFMFLASFSLIVSAVLVGSALAQEGGEPTAPPEQPPPESPPPQQPPPEHPPVEPTPAEQPREEPTTTLEPTEIPSPEAGEGAPTQPPQQPQMPPAEGIPGGQPGFGPPPGGEGQPGFGPPEGEGFGPPPEEEGFDEERRERPKFKEIPADVLAIVPEKDFVEMFCYMTKWKAGGMVSNLEQGQSKVSAAKAACSSAGIEIDLPDLSSLASTARQKMDAICSAATVAQAEQATKDLIELFETKLRSSFEGMRDKIEPQFKRKREQMQEKIEAVIRQEMASMPRGPQMGEQPAFQPPQQPFQQPPEGQQGPPPGEGGQMGPPPEGEYGPPPGGEQGPPPEQPPPESPPPESPPPSGGGEGGQVAGYYEIFFQDEQPPPESPPPQSPPPESPPPQQPPPESPPPEQPPPSEPPAGPPPGEGQEVPSQPEQPQQPAPPQGPMVSGPPPSVEQPRFEDPRPRIEARIQAIIGDEKRRMEECGKALKTMGEGLRPKDGGESPEYRAKAIAKRRQVVRAILDKKIGDAIKELEEGRAFIEEERKTDASLRPVDELISELRSDKAELLAKLDTVSDDEEAFDAAMEAFKEKWEAVRQAMQKKFSAKKVCAKPLLEIARGRSAVVENKARVSALLSSCTASGAKECQKVLAYRTQYRELLVKFDEILPLLDAAEAACSRATDDAPASEVAVPLKTLKEKYASLKTFAESLR